MKKEKHIWTLHHQYPQKVMMVAKLLYEKLSVEKIYDVMQKRGRATSKYDVVTYKSNISILLNRHKISMKESVGLQMDPKERMKLLNL